MDSIKKVGMSAKEYWRPTRPKDATPPWVRRGAIISKRTLTPDNIDILIRKLDAVKLKQD